MDKIKVFTTFSGYDSQCLALKYAGIPFDLVGWSEIDKYAIQAHNALFPEYSDKNYGDVSKIDWSTVEDFDLLTYSSPCQDISVAGRQQGLVKDSGTRSSLLWEIEKAIQVKKPRYLLMENVAALVSDKFIGDFNKWLLTLERYGYTSHWKVLDASKYQIPQHRERVFVVSILGDHIPFYWPKPKKQNKTLADILETNVSERYFLNDEAVQARINHCERKQEEGCGFKFLPQDGGGTAQTITTRYGTRETDCYIKDA